MSQQIDNVARAEKFEELRKNKPGRGDVLRGVDNAPVPVFIDTKDDGRVMFCKAFIDEACTGWYLCDDPKALTVLIIENEHAGILANNDDKTEGITLNALRVIRSNRKGTALIAEPYYVN